MRNDQMEMLADAIIESVALPLDSFHDRIKALELADDVTVLETIDFGRQYPDCTLAVWKNGLWIYRLKSASWTCISRSIWAVRITPEAGGSIKLELELSDGHVITSTTTKPALKKAATKPVKLVRKPTKPVSLETA